LSQLGVRLNRPEELVQFKESHESDQFGNVLDVMEDRLAGIERAATV
jgi:hypothetical protein